MTERRTIVLLCASVALATTAIFGTFALASVMVLQLTDSPAWVGVPAAVTFIGIALASVGLSRQMARHGRKRGLLLGWALACVGGALGVLSAALESLWLLLAAVALLGAGHAASTLARYAAADLAERDRRAFAIGLIVWAMAAGAIVGPSLVSLAERIAVPRLAPGTGGFMLAAFSAGLSALVAAALPEHAWPPMTAEEPSPRLLGRTRVRIALVALVANQAAMVLVMAVTPAHLVSMDAGLGLVGLVASSHFAGMFVLGPVMGGIADRIGGGPATVAGVLLLAASCVSAALWPDAAVGLLSVPLFAVGVGWSLTFVSASSELTHGLSPKAALAAQGAVDGALWLVSAAASFLGGLLLARVGFSALATIAAVLLPLPTAWVFAKRHELTEVRGGGLRT